MEGNQEPMVQNTEVKKPKKGINPILCILLILVFYFVGYFCGKYFYNLTHKEEPKNETKEETKKEEQQEEAKDITLTEADQTTIMDKMTELLFGKRTNKLIRTPNYEINNYWEDMFSGNYTNERKEYNTLSLLKPLTIKIDKNHGIYKDPYKDKAIYYVLEDNNLEIIKRSDFVSKYKYLYGEEPKLNDTSKIDGCPGYTYLSNYDYFVIYHGCGGAGGPGNMVYIDNFKTKGNDAIVETYVGGFSTDTSKYEVYADYTKSTGTQTALYNKNVNIQESNKTKFTRYNFIFTKAQDGNLYFTKIEKAS